MQGFAREALRQVALAEAVLPLWQHVCEPKAVQDIFERHRGACYTDTLTFPVLVNLGGDALLEHQGSGRKRFERAQESGALSVSIVAASAQGGRLPTAVSEAFLTESTDRVCRI